MDGSFNDLYFAGSGSSRLAIVGGSTTVPETHTFELYHSNRCTWWNVDFQNPVNRVDANGNANSTSIFTSNSDLKYYYTILGCTETGRSNPAVNNSMLLVSLFSTQNIVFEGNTATGVAGFGFFFKDSNRYVTAAYNKVNLPIGGPAFLFGCQVAHVENGPPGLCEACYNFIINGALFFDFRAAWAPCSTGRIETRSTTAITITTMVLVTGAPQAPDLAERRRQHRWAKRHSTEAQLMASAMMLVLGIGGPVVNPPQQGIEEGR